MKSNDHGMWTNREPEKIIADLRAEAAAQKACITQYAFQGIGLTAVGWGLVFKAGPTDNGLYLIGIIIVFMLLSVIRLANHKYGSINRNLGYELHLYRLKDYRRLGRNEWAAKMLDIGWEEAMCVWRIVQPTLFTFLYTGSPTVLSVYRVRKAHRDKPYKWYATPSILDRNATYHAGTYLRNVHLMLGFAAVFSIATMWTFFMIELQVPSLRPTDYAIGTLLLVTTGFFIIRFLRERSFRSILEGGLLSIQASAVIWRLVATAHILASEMAFSRHKTYYRYTQYVSEVAVAMTHSFYTLHEWLAQWEDKADRTDVFSDLDAICSPMHASEAVVHRN